MIGSSQSWAAKKRADRIVGMKRTTLAHTNPQALHSVLGPKRIDHSAPWSEDIPLDEIL